MAKVYRFEERPITGDKVKVYLAKKKCAYGTVVGIKIKPDIYNENTRKRVTHEILVLKRTDEIFKPEDAKYCLPHYKIEWEE